MKLVDGKMVNPNDINGPIEVIDDDDGRWWLRCLNKKCDGDFGVWEFDNVKKDKDVFKNGLSLLISGYIVCGKCWGKMERHQFLL